MIINRFFTATIVAGFLFALQLSSSVVWAGEARGRAESEWEAVVKAAKAEGQLAIYANTSFEATFPEFRKKYPEIKITYVTGVGAPDVVPRVLSEQRGGKFLGDLALLGGSGLYSLYQAKALDPLKPALMLPATTKGVESLVVSKRTTPSSVVSIYRAVYWIGVCS